MNIIQDKFVCCVVELPATKLALDMFVRDRSTTAREKDLFRSVKVLRYLSHAPHSHCSRASSSAECSRDKPPFSFVRGQDSTM